MTDLQTAIEAAAADLVAAGTETGLQVAVRRHGRVVADVNAGLADPRTGAETRPDTLFFAASATKGVATSLAHVLAERGDIAYDLRLADVWPEFAANGKKNTTLRHVLMHTAGLPGLPPETTARDLCDWDRMCAGLAAAEPWWEPGTRFGYHALTWGFLLGETIRRATGQTVTELLRKHLTAPLGVTDELCFAVPTHLLPTMARQQASAGSKESPEPPKLGSAAARAMPPALRDPAALGRNPKVLTADILSLGTMTARGAALMYSALLGHENGLELVSSRRRTEMAAVAFTGMDEVMGFPSRWAFGYSPGRPGGVPTRDGSAFGMIGSNGSAAYADIDSGLAVAIMRNGPPAGLDAVTRIDQLIADHEEKHP